MKETNVTDTSVASFIQRFHVGETVDDVFTCGCCYYFALSLFFRFRQEGATIMYDPTLCHFGTKIKGRVYDITGDITDSGVWYPWDEYEDEKDRNRIIEHCIMF